MTVIALTGNTGGRIRDRLTETDVHICVPHERTARIQEVHLLVLHCLCDAVDLQLLGRTGKHMNRNLARAARLLLIGQWPAFSALAPRRWSAAPSSAARSSRPTAGRRGPRSRTK
jgi:hypothetical protein